MRLQAITILCAASLVASSAAADVAVRGGSTGCAGGERYQPNNMQIYVFDASKSVQLIGLLKEIEAKGEPNLDDQADVERFFARYARLMRLVRTEKSLGATKGNRKGAFEIRIEGNVDTVLVFGYVRQDEGEGTPRYAYSQTKVNNQSIVSVTLDLNPGYACGSRPGNSQK